MNSKLRIKYGPIEFEIESDPTTIEKERKVFMDTLPTIAAFSNIKHYKEIENEILEENIDDSKRSQLQMPKQTINTFITDLGVNTDIDKCLAVIYFMSEEEKENIINKQSIEERMRKSKLSIPKSISVALNGLASKGYIQNTDGEDSKLMNYYITHEGKEYIENYEKKEKKVKKTTKSRKVTTSNDNRYNNITKESLELEKYPDYYLLKTSKDKIMFIMYVFNKSGRGEYFTVSEIKQIISYVFNDRLTDDAIKGVFKNKASSKFFDKRKLEKSNKIQEYKMLQIGYQHFEKNYINIENN